MSETRAAAAARDSSRTLAAGLLAWVFPGLGHLFLGRRGKGLVLMGSILALFVLSVMMDSRLQLHLGLEDPLALLFSAALVAEARRRSARGFELALLALALVALPVAWMFARLAVLVGLLAPPCAALALARWPRRGLALALFGALSLAQAGLFAGFVREHRLEWYLPPRARAELTALIEFVRANVPPAEPIAGDFVNSTALLAHTRHPIVLQPKYETDRSRRQAEAFLTTFFQRSTAELAELLRERFRCRYLLVDRYVLWELSRATAGLRADEREPRPGTAAEAFLSDSDEVLTGITGFELLYRSPRGIPGADYRFFRMR